VFRVTEKSVTADSCHSALKHKCIQPSYVIEVEGQSFLGLVKAGEYKNLTSLTAMTLMSCVGEPGFMTAVPGLTQRVQYGIYTFAL